MSLTLIRLAIHINNKLHNCLYKPCLEWDPGKVLLQRTSHGKINFWRLDLFLVTFLYGIVACIYCSVREVLIHKMQNIRLINLTFFLSGILASFAQIIARTELNKCRTEVLAGINALLIYRRKLYQCKLILS